jgi:hypothetical protein
MGEALKTRSIVKLACSTDALVIVISSSMIDRDTPSSVPLTFGHLRRGQLLAFQNQLHLNLTDAIMQAVLQRDDEGGHGARIPLSLQRPE